MRRLTVLFVTVLVLYAKIGIADDIAYSEIKDLLQIGGNVKITQIAQNRSAKSLDSSIDNVIENFIKSNEVSMHVPFGSTVTFNGRALDSDEFDIKLHLNSEDVGEARKKKIKIKKSKIKKILPPILVVLLLKAITLIPLAIGLLGLKTWNALQLGFVSFVTSVVLAVWKLCSKFSDHHHQAPHIIHEAVHDVHIPHVYHDSHHDHHVVHHDHHEPWDHHYHRSDDISAQQVAYNGYASEGKI